MAQETVKAFFKQVETDQRLSDQYKALVTGMAEAKMDETQATAQVAAFAAQQGYTFTAEDVQLAAAEMQGDELTDEELDAVAGGRLRFRILLIVSHAPSGSAGCCVIIGYSVSGSVG